MQREILTGIAVFENKHLANTIAIWAESKRQLSVSSFVYYQLVFSDRDIVKLLGLLKIIKAWEMEMCQPIRFNWEHEGWKMPFGSMFSPLITMKNSKSLLIPSMFPS